MSTLSVTELLKFSELQMAAEAFLIEGNIPKKGDAYYVALIRGNDHASQFTTTGATRFSREWEVLAQTETRTGFSGTLFRNKANRDELVVSLRSTEFIDDAVRDNMATNTLEINATGWAWGQMADMQAWMAGLRGNPALLGDKGFSLTGYSLGGHLATAYNLLNPGVANQVVTFNGAGVGRMAVGDITQVQALGQALGQVLQEFSTLRGSSDAIRARLTESRALGLYDTVRTHLAAQAQEPWTVVQAYDHVVGRTQSGVVTAQELLLLEALQGMYQLEVEARRLRSVTRSDGSGAPKAVELSETAAYDLDYRMAVGFASRHTQAMGQAGNLQQALAAKNIPAVLSNQVDVVADSWPSAVSHSQWHYGQDRRVPIEDQPLYRGGIGWTALHSSLSAAHVALLVDGYDKKDFGDTHSLVLIVDSLMVQNTLLQLLPSRQRDTSATTDLMKQVLARCSGLVKEDGALSMGDGQGKAEGDVLENLVNALERMFLGEAAGAPLKGNPEGATWARMADEGGYSGRNTLHERLSRIHESQAYKDLAGQCNLQLSDTPAAALEKAARDDFGAYVALQTLSPFLLQAPDNALRQALGGPWRDIYTRWNGGEVTDEWLQDRSALLRHLGRRNADNIQGALSGPELARYYDVASKTEILIRNHTNYLQRVQYIFGGDGDDDETVMLGYGKNDHLYGGAGDDRLKGQGGADHLDGGDGDDMLDGGEGRDTLIGGAGDDTYLAGDGDTIVDSDGKGSLQLGDKQVAGAFTRQSENVWTDAKGVTCRVSGKDLIVRCDGLQVTLENAHARAVSDAGFLGIRLGSEAPDVAQTSRTWTGAATGNYWVWGTSLKGAAYRDTAGDELFDMGPGVDIVISNEGNDQFYGRGGNDLFLGGQTANIAYGGDGDDTLLKGMIPVSEPVRTWVPGNAYSPGYWTTQSRPADLQRAEYSFYGGAVKAYGMNGSQDGNLADGDDRFFGEAGNDWLLGGRGDDWLDGGADDDVVFGGKGNDDIIGGSGDDILSGDNLGRDRWDGENLGGENLVSNNLGVNLGSLTLSGRHGDDFIDAGIGNDKVFGNGGDDIIHGGTGDDALWGDDEALSLSNHGDDTIDAGEGNDKVYAGGGNDLVHGQEGDDLLVGGEGSDRLFGGAGDDRLVGDLAQTSDIYSGVKLYAHANGDLLNALQGRAESQGSIIGAYQPDASQSGDDWLDGGAGDDDLEGGAGDDTLIGGTGNDSLDGGEGADRYVFSQGDGADVIRPVQGADQLLLGGGLDWKDASVIRQGGDLRIAWSGGDSILVQGYFGTGNDSRQLQIFLADGTELDEASILARLGDGIHQNLPGTGGWTACSPTVSQPRLTLVEGRGDTAVVLALDALGVRDADSTPEQITLEVSGVGGGRFMRADQEVSRFSAADVQAGRIRFVHGFGSGTPAFRLAATDEAGLDSGEPVEAAVDFTPAAQIIFGDASGSGGAAGYTSLDGGNGGGGDDTLVGTDQGDVIFGDGSGGGEGQRTGWWGSNAGSAGRAGAGNDRISGGGGNDLIFGDGFDGGEVTAGLNRGGAGGYGGGGSGSGNDWASVGGGAGHTGQGWDSGPGGAASLGPQALGGGVVYSNGHNRGGAGAGVGTPGTRGAGAHGHTDPIQDALELATYQRVLADLNNRWSAIHTQTMGAGHDALDGGAGDDWLMGGGGNDVLIGGTGNDMLDGGAGDDTYRIGAGDGQDVILCRTASGADRLELGQGLDAAGMQLQRSGADLLLGWASGQAIALKDYFSHLLPATRQGHGAPSDTLTLAFADGSTWQAGDVRERLGVVLWGDASGSGGAAGYVSHSGGHGGGDDDTLTGTDQGDVIFGDGSGGGEGQRTGWWGSNAGSAGRAGAGNDRISGGGGNDLIFGDGFDGGEVTAGLSRGGAGGYGGGGSGSGNDWASVGGGAGGTGQAEASTPGAAASLGPEAAGGPVVYSNGHNRGGTGAGVGTPGGGGHGNADQIQDTLELAIYQRVLADLSNPQSAIYSQAMGGGNDELDGGAGDDWLIGGGGDDVLRGGLGLDQLLGGRGSDSYLLGRGDGWDTIVENDATAGHRDVARLGSGIAVDQVWLQQSGKDLKVGIIGTEDGYLVKDWYLGGQHHVEEFRTESGQVLRESSVQDLVDAMAEYTPPTLGQMHMSPEYAALLQPLITVSWQ